MDYLKAFGLLIIGFITVLIIASFFNADEIGITFAIIYLAAIIGAKELPQKV